VRLHPPSSTGSTRPIRQSSSSSTKWNALAGCHRFVEDGLNGFAHRPDQLRHEIAGEQLQLRSLVALEAAATALPHIDERLGDRARAYGVSRPSGGLVY
jgi:hypothetical protein